MQLSGGDLLVEIFNAATEIRMHILAAQTLQPVRAVLKERRKLPSKFSLKDEFELEEMNKKLDQLPSGQQLVLKQAPRRLFQLKGKRKSFDQPPKRLHQPPKKLVELRIIFPKPAHCVYSPQTFESAQGHLMRAVIYTCGQNSLLISVSAQLSQKSQHLQWPVEMTFCVQLHPTRDHQMRVMEGMCDKPGANAVPLEWLAMNCTSSGTS